MRYLGGKSRLAKDIAQIVNSARPTGARVWEPFMGGGAVSVALAKGGPVDCSDTHDALITMWRAAVEDEWIPDPRIIAEGMYAAYKARQDPTDPYTAFLGYGCSYGGIWFGGFAGWSYTRLGTKPYKEWRDYRVQQTNTLINQSHILRTSGSRVFQFDFLAEYREDWPPGWPIYCDPPYVDTTGYSAAGEFDHGLFWERVAQYARRGVPVFVSEFADPPSLDGVVSECVWSKKRKNQMNGADVVDRLDLFMGCD